MSKNTTIVWFKNDLRLHDNETLCKAIASGDQLILIYCLDPRNFGTLSLGFRKADYNRFIFLKQTIIDLSKKLESRGACLSILIGEPELEIPKIVSKYNVSTIYTEDEYAFEELEVLQALRQNLISSCSLQTVWGKTLYHKDDIPYPIKDIPLTSKAYRINTTKTTKVREPFLDPVTIHCHPQISDTKFPEASAFGYRKDTNVSPYVPGGESNALQRLNTYTFETEQLSSYRWTRNQSLGMEYSSKFSPYLAVGSLSPRLIYQKVKEYEKLVKKNQSTWWIIFELVWRDYFTFKGMRMGSKIFRTEGYRNKQIPFENDTKLFDRWKNGTTGIPFIDAHMRQLNATGYMSNRGRVNCSSFLIHDYKIDWTWGASYFESKLIDYDVSANWMNWHVQAYEIWYTNPIHQSLKYNSKAYIQKWISELVGVEDHRIYIPWTMKDTEFQTLNYHKPDQIHSKWTRAINNILKSIENSH